MTSIKDAIEEELIISSFNYSEKNLFNDHVCLMNCELSIDKKKYCLQVLINTNFIEYDFVNISTAQKICKKLDIIFQMLMKFRTIKTYDDYVEKLITHVIYSIMKIHDYVESLIFLLIIYFEQQDIILDKS